MANFSCNVISPRIRQQLMNKMKEDYQQAIEEKDAAIALLSDDLRNRKYENAVLQAQRDVYQTQLQRCQDTIIHLRTRYMDHARVSGKDNIIIILRKHTRPANDNIIIYHIMSQG